MLSPAFGLYNAREMGSLLSSLQRTNTNTPDRLYNFEPKEGVPQHKQSWHEDDRNLSWWISLHTLTVNLNAFESFQRNMPSVDIPSLTVRGGLDEVISNQVIEKWFDGLDDSIDKTMITLDDAQHDILGD